MKNKTNEDAERVKAEEARMKAQFLANVVYHLSASDLTLDRMSKVACALDLDINIALKPQAKESTSHD